MISILESRFGHVVARLLPAWGNPEAFQELFDDLIFDKRGTRAGWPVDAWEELQFLQKLHKVRMAMEASAEAVEENPIADEQKWVN
jgi:hypothetical protein